ncbi:MAG: ABC transporter ATP-binding protein [Planctomycetes bacterium]|nr:ABC transporter ATP-binding protein [Planctomycetota bacterium]
MSAIHLQGVSRTYGQGSTAVRALADVDLEVEAGAFVMVRGRSGSGKTTLLNLLAGLDSPTAGSVRVAGQELSRLGDRALSRFRNQSVGYVFQAFYLESGRSAWENAALPLVFAGVPAAERRRRAGELLEQVGLGDKLDAPASNLSAGQRQRVALARALINRPSLLLADEPTANLDSRTSDGILQLIGELHERSGVTVVIVTHDHALDGIGTRDLTVEDGRVREAERAP